MSGGFVLVVGPSGAGKDTLIALAREALAGDTRFAFPRRVVTRPPSPWEDHDSIDPAGFERVAVEGGFCLFWQAHGLGYGIPETALAAAEAGVIVVCNVSRAVVATARAHLPAVSVVEVTAPAPILAARLAKRGRKEDGAIEERLRRSEALVDVRADLTIVNDGSAADGAARLVAHLEHRAARLRAAQPA